MSVTVTAIEGILKITGQTYPVRRHLMRAGATWRPNEMAWVMDDTPHNRKALEELGYTVGAAIEGKKTPVRVELAAIEPESSEKAVKMTETPKQERAAKADKAPAAANAGLEAALAAFVARHAQGAASVDADTVRDIVREEMASMAPRRLEIVQGDNVRQIEGLQHKSLATLIQCLGARLNVWLAGPSGSGKTHGAEQAAAALGLPFWLQGAMTMAHELTGFVDANGHYHETPFVKAFRDGGVILLDELDAGSNEALLTLNAALANGIMCLPSGENIRAHDNFRCIGAANTWGAGATAEYVGRTRIDAAFLQRFGARIQWDYDLQLERAMTGNDAWVDRVQTARVRAAAKGLKVLITPRACIAGARLIASGMKPDEAANLTFLADLTPDQRALIGEKA